MPSPDTGLMPQFLGMLYGVLVVLGVMTLSGVALAVVAIGYHAIKGRRKG